MIASALIGLAIVLFRIGAGFWNSPLGPQLIVPTPGSDSVSDEISSLPDGQFPVENATSYQSDDAPQPVCGGPETMNLLIIGIDSQSSDYTTGFADVIRVVRIDFVHQSARLLSIPRDLWTHIPGLEQYGIVENRIKNAYAYGSTYEVPGGGPSLLAQTLASEFDLHADHYVALSFDAFEAGVNAVGGIDIVVAGLEDGSPVEIRGFEPGLQHMDGATTLAYARFRGGDTDLLRINRQTQVILAIHDKVTSPQTLPTVPRLVNTLRGSVLTDMSPAEISSLVCIGQAIGPQAITTMNIDASMANPATVATAPPGAREILLPDYQAIKQLVRRFNEDFRR